MKKTKREPRKSPRELEPRLLESVVGGAGTGINVGPHPNPPIGPGG